MSAGRFFSATLRYVQFPSGGIASRPWALWINRVVHPVPFLALLFLLFTAWWRPLHKIQWIVVGVYCVYLVPNVAASYYERYGMPLLGVKILFMVLALDRLLSYWPRAIGG